MALANTATAKKWKEKAAKEAEERVAQRRLRRVWKGKKVSWQPRRVKKVNS